MEDLVKSVHKRVVAEPPPARTERPVPPEPSPEMQAPEPQPSRRWVWVVAGVAVAGLGIWAATSLNRSTTPGADAGEALTVTATVERRDFVRSVRIHGTVEALESYPVAAPRLAGPGPGNMVITALAAAGSPVKRGDLLVEFDRQTQLKNFLDRQAEYREREEQIKKLRAEQAAARARDDTELKAAENALETARLELRKNEVVSRIDAEKNQQNFLEAEARLAQLRETFNLKRTAERAALRILEIQRDRAENAMRHAERNAEKMAIRSEIHGLVVLNPIWKGGRMDEVMEGDEVRPGVPFLQVVNPGAMQVRARVNQADVQGLQAGQRVEVRLDAYPELKFPGRVERIAAIGVTSGMSSTVRTFTATFSIEGTDPKLMPDLSAAVDVEFERLPNVLVVPRDAVWIENGQAGGQAWVEVQRGSGFEKRAVTTGRMCDHEIVIESGIDAGAVVKRHVAGMR